MTIAALYVEAGGCYTGLPDVDAWDEARDARLYAGPYPVVAHPPCQRWGKLWAGQPLFIKRTGIRKIKGDDGGCFKAAIASVRQWGGVIEHPWQSHAWPHFGLNTPDRAGRWIVADFYGGWTCCVEQGRYGHYARSRRCFMRSAAICRNWTGALANRVWIPLSSSAWASNERNGLVRLAQRVEAPIARHASAPRRHFRICC